MKEPLRLLLIEDSEEDAFFILRYLKRDGRELSSERVSSLEELAAALEDPWDAVVSDWSLPGFDALDALALIREKDPDLPFVIVSATIGEERAVEAMKAGAHDYVPKSNLARLRVAIEREMEAARARWAQRQVEERYRSIFENAVEGIFQTTIEGRPVLANPAMARILGYESPEEALQCIHDVAGQLYVKPERRAEFERVMREQGAVRGFEVEMYRKNGDKAWVSVSARVLRNGGGEPAGYEGIVEDIAGRKRAEAALKESEEQYRMAFHQAAAGMAHVGLSGSFLQVNESFCETLGYRREELLEMDLQQVSVLDDLDEELRNVERAVEGRLRTYSMEKRYVRKDGSRIWVDLTVSLVRDAENAPRYFFSVVRDITQSKLAGLVPEPLLPQEKDVLKLIVRGLTNQEIAEELNYSLGAIKLHVRGILAKLGVESRKQAAWKAVEIGLLPPPNGSLPRNG